MEHTKEPWRVELSWITGSDGKRITCPTACMSRDDDENEANERRIVACVNACAGISDEALESWMNPPDGGFGHPHGPWPAHIISLQRATEIVAQQRDDLMAAIRLTLDENGHLADGDVCTLKRLKDALAKVGADGTAAELHNVEVSGCR